MPPQAVTPHLGRQRQILALVAEIGENLDSYQVDDIDGAFFWRFCRPEVAERLGRARAGATPLDIEAAVNTAADLWAEYGIPIGATLAHLERGVPLPMRAAGVTLQVNEHGAIDRLKVSVLSAALTGEDVERLATEQVASAAARPGWIAPAAPPRAIWLDFEFVGASTAGEDYDHIRPAHLELTIGVPLPPPRVIALAFDGVMEGEGWREALRRSAPKQEKETALRTWGTALLAASGPTVRVAQDKVSDATGLEPVTQTMFGRNRLDLLARVPEAEPCVMQRHRRSPGLRTR